LAYLDLDYNQLNGDIPSQLGNLTGIETLSIDHNRLSGSIPPSLGDLGSLRRLDLYRNQLSGNIPGQLGNLSNLGSLNLSNNALSGTIPTSLGNLSNLEDLNLGGNQFEGNIPNQLGNLSNIRYLYLYDNQLTGSIPSQLGNRASLRTLELGGNQFSGTLPPELQNLAQLEILWVWGNHLSGVIPDWLGNMSELRYLGLGGNQFTGGIPPELRNLTKLQSLNLSQGQLNGTIPAWLGELDNLWYLSLCANQFDEQIPPSLGNLSNLWYLYLYDNQLTGSIPGQLGNLSNLRTLNLRESALSGQIPASLGNLENLQELDLAFNQLNGSIPSQLGQLNNLVVLMLGWNGLSSNIPFELGNLENLYYLNLGNNRLRGSIPSTFENLTNLDYLFLFGNQLEGNIPQQLCPVTWWPYNMMNKQSHCVPTILQGWPNPRETQTTPPDYLYATAESSTTVRLRWQPIPYTSDGGYYEISYAHNFFGPYTVQGVTTDKGEYQYVVDGLSPNTTYYFRLRTYTPAHDPFFQRNESWSNYGAVITARTPDSNPPPLTQMVYLPHVQHPGPGPGPRPTPGATSIYSIEDDDCDGDYLFRWLPVAGATNYLVEETNTDPFGGVITVYDGPNTFVSIESRTPETYSYRVQAQNRSGDSAWSETVEIRVCAEEGQAASFSHRYEQETLTSFSAFVEKRKSSDAMAEGMKASEFEFSGQHPREEPLFANSGLTSALMMVGKERPFLTSPVEYTSRSSNHSFADGPWKDECPQGPLPPDQWQILPPNYLERCPLASLMRR